MSSIYPIYTDRVRYKLTHNPTGQQIVEEPVGFNSDDNEFVRDGSFHGIFPQMTNDLTFYNSGYNFIKNIYDIYGINADLILTKEERNPSTDEWQQSYTGFLDFSTYSRENQGVSIKFVSSGLLRIIKARQNESIELDRLDTLSGKEIAYLEPNQVALEGRNIQLNSLLETGSEYTYSEPTTENSIGFREFSMRFQNNNNYFGTMGYPLLTTYVSDIKINQFSGGRLSMITYAQNDTEVGRVESMFYIDSDRDKKINVKLKYKFSIFDANKEFGIGNQRDIKELDNANFYLRISKYRDSIDYIFKEEVINFTGNMISGNTLIKNNYDSEVDGVQTEFNIELLKGESLSLQFFGTATDWGGSFSSGNLRPTFKDMTSSVEILEDSAYFPSRNNVHLPFDVANRFLELFTDTKNLLVSNVLGKKEDGYQKDGEASLIGISHGFWVRGFSKDDAAEANGQNRYKPMTTSFKEFYESYFGAWHLGAGVEKIGFKETFRIEKLDYFYNKNVLIRLGSIVNGKFKYSQVTNVRRSLETDSFYSGLEIGYTKGGKYEEAIGLDEYNTKTTFTTVIDKLEQIYSVLIKYRADSYGLEFARRKPFSLFPTEDTKYDDSIWLLDLVRTQGSNIFSQRLWQNDFSEKPTGVFSPDTAQNLRLSPFNILLRHGWEIGTGLVKYPLDLIRYGSSVANSGLTTKLKSVDYPQYGGVSHSENGNIENKNLETARMDGEIIEFEFNVDYDLLQKVQGKTVVLGKEIPNFYGLVSFMNEEGEIEEGYIQKLSPNGVGNWTIKKFNTI